MEVRRGSLVACAIIAFALLAPGFSLGRGLSADAAESEGSWTVAVYVDADCSLEAYWEDPSLAYLMNIPASDGLKIVAVVDWLSVEGVERVEITEGSYEVVEKYPEMNFGDGDTFQWFLTLVDTCYHSDHLVVIPWNHGSAWKGFCWDDTNDSDRITLQEMEDAIVGAGVYIDILAFDACSCSSIEMAYQAAKTGLVELLVASEELVAGNGFPYDKMFTPVALDPSRTPVQVAEDMLAGWTSEYEPLVWGWYCTLGIVDITVIRDSLDVFSDWVAQMAEGLEDFTYNYRIALRDSYYVSCGSHYQVDLVDLGNHLMSDKTLAKDTELMDATEAMVALIEEAVIDVYNTDTTASCGGVSVYWGSHNSGWRTNYAEYLEVAFPEDSGWGEFVFTYNQLTAGWMRITK